MRARPTQCPRCGAPLIESRATGRVYCQDNDEHYVDESAAAEATATVRQ